MKRLLTAAIVLILAASCGSGTTETGKKILPFLTNESDPQSVRVFREIFAEFSRSQPSLSVDLVLGTHEDIGQRLITAARVGADLGIVQVRAEQIHEFIRAGYLLPLDDVVDSVGADEFRSGAVIRGADGRAYAMAYAGGSFGTLWVRSDHLQEVGLPPPSSYDELLTAARKMTRDLDGDGRIDIYGIGLPAGPDMATTSTFIGFLHQNCGDYFDGEGRLVFDRPQVLEAVKRYVALLKYAPSAVIGWSWFDGLEAFFSGRIAMYVFGGRLGVNLERSAPNIRRRTQVIWLPAGERRGGRVHYDYFAVYRGARYTDEAKALLRYFFSEDRLRRFLLTVPGHLLPPTRSLSQRLLEGDHPYIKKYREDMKLMLASADFGSDPTVFMGTLDPQTCEYSATYRPIPWGRSLFGRKPPVDAEMIQRIVVNKEPVEQAWKKACAQMQQIAAEWKKEHPDWRVSTEPRRKAEGLAP